MDNDVRCEIAEIKNNTSTNDSMKLIAHYLELLLNKTDELEKKNNRLENKIYNLESKINSL